MVVSPKSVERLPKFWLFVFYSSGVFVCFLVNGLASEAIFLLPGFRTFGWFLTLFQYGFYVICSYLQTHRWETASNFRNLKVPMRSYAMLTLLTAVTMGLSNASVGYMNYPTQLVFKSCKIPLVMVGAIILQNKRYDLYDFFAVFSMTSGLIFFTLVDSTISPQFQPKGIIMVCCALIADAYVGNMQEKLMKMYSLTQATLIFKTYSFGFILIFLLTLLTGEFNEAVQFCLQNLSSTVPLLVVFSITGYLGINFVLALISTFGAVWAVTVTTLRKAITISLSFILFEKTFSMHYVWSGFLVILGIYMNSHKRPLLAFCDFLLRSILKLVHAFRVCFISRRQKSFSSLEIYSSEHLV